MENAIRKGSGLQPALFGAALAFSLIWRFVMPAHVVGNRHMTVRHRFVLSFCLDPVLARGTNHS